ncbi:MAG: hypothetical protein V1885_02970 [Candidatus Brennerbacteria bacterium]
MPAHKGWVQEIAEGFYWIIQDKCKLDFAKRFRFEIREGFAYVYCEGCTPEAVLKVVNEEFFKLHNLHFEKWETVFRFPWPNEEWRLYRSTEHSHFPDTRFGWRYREMLLVETLPVATIASPSYSPDVVGKAAVSAEALPENGEPPAFARKFMD